MAARKKPMLKPRKLSTPKAKRVARNLRRATVMSIGRSGFMRPLSLKSTATGMGTVVFRASHVLGGFARAGKF